MRLGCDETFEADQRVRVIGKANGGKASALNAGIAVAHGEILFFVDADGLLHPTRSVKC
jgi:glycosyltransferase involved in cell wall biosynthesis